MKFLFFINIYFARFFILDSKKNYIFLIFLFINMLRNRILSQAVNRTFRPAPWQMDNLTDIGSRSIFTDEHDTMREQFRKFWRSIDRERTKKWSRQEIGKHLE